MSFQQNTIQRDLITIPTLLFTNRALLQLKLILENDFTLASKYFRIVISGKGCDGFTYASGFTDKMEEDFEVKIENADEDFYILMDPFAAFYLQTATVDFIQDFSKDSEGFVIVNHLQDSYKGKFWRKNEELTPPLKSNIDLNA